ncbi:MAG TPA: hypothetical protein VEA69_07425 [Tepidisphaeraceae bacterium]|nr:hypothetical protein [Tepidisphaeraceae bacterium]
MTVRIKAHYDGKTIVPDEPVNLPPDTELTVLLSYPERHPLPSVFPLAPTETERAEALARFISRPVHGLSIPDDALRRENMYSDEDDR